MALTKNKVGFVDGTISRPMSHDLIYGAWNRCSLDVNSYFTKLKILWDELREFQPVPVCHCGGLRVWTDYQHREYVLQFLMGLNDSYAQIRGQILMMDPLPAINKVFSLVIQEERHRTVGYSYSGSHNSDPMTFGSNSNAPAGSSGGSKTRRDRITCSYCGFQGHTKDKCYKLVGYPPGWKFKNKGPNSIFECGSSESTFLPSLPCWIIDSGATHHVCNDISLFDSFIAVQNVRVTLPIGIHRCQASKCVVCAYFRYNLLSSIISLDFDSFVLDKAFVATSRIPTTNILSLWHSRLGHPSFSRSKGLQYVLDFDSSFDLTPAIVEGYKFFLTIVDDYSRVTWVYMLKNKSEVQKYIPDFFAFVKKQFGKEVKAIRSDNAPELFLSNFYHSLGVIHYRSCVETPQQNSVVERKHQHILNVALYLINRTPSPFLNNKTPFEILHDKLPDYSHLRVFGCLCYVSTLKANRTKFSPRAKAAVFLGYPFGFKGYKLLDIETRSISISRNVIFHEEIFPFSKTNPCSSPDISSDLFHDRVLPCIAADNDQSSSVLPRVVSQPPLQVAPSSRPTRVSKQPSYLKDYHCSLINSVAHVETHSTSHPIQHFLSYDKLSPSYKLFLSRFPLFEPALLQRLLKTEWRAAMDCELEALEENKTWSIVIKHKADGTIERYKARLVAKGYTQREGIDYVDTFHHGKTSDLNCFWLFFFVKGWHLSQLDVNNAFLHGDLNEEVYMNLCLESLFVCFINPYMVSNKPQDGFLSFLRHYGLGIHQSPSDHSLFIKNVDGLFIALLVYVDDVIIASNNQRAILDLKSELNKLFKLKDLGDVKYFLGLEIAKSSLGICVSRKYSASTPMEANVKLSMDEGLIFRCRLSQFISRPKLPHLHAAQRILRYLKGNPGMGLRSVTGFCVFLGNSLVSWKSKKQHIIDCHLVRDKVQSGVLKPMFVSTEHQLADLVKIMKCKEEREQMVVIPIFYHVDPSSANQTEIYREAFTHHKKNAMRRERKR
ncbi:hypothetical protein AAG906_000446 [Vitis piasezkii]